MPYVDNGEARIWYTEQGTGFPMLTLAPGGMRSSVPLWEMAAINPLTAYAGQYRMIAMDQRNAGQSTGPLEAGDPWGAYASDQLAVMDHLGIDRFLVFGCCIGGPFILKLLQLAPERVVAAVLEQPVGIIARNRGLFDNLWKQWGEQLVSKRVLLALKVRLTADAIHHLVAPDADEPGARIDRKSGTRPALQCNSAGFLQCVLSQIEIADEADQGGQHPPRLVAQNIFDACRRH